ncbi:glycosyltransferase family 25 protein [Aureibacter tunicatorum]|uniref:Fe2OG dioxygenase domain-containing protein n=1 Tax=Aureibacter tunicatorum TaxID=866807 RepID=A0AAE3XKI2_9BACT|nr:glycosyltransferase family 25 protein [Aureibacter tunicatorum]MDR6239496.1 hypothetical protein [Aureibacter tunicatorum]BDD04584.1 hypothetical protein AUTU_20670 [Aureibacter tunicatorum]
MKKIENKLDWVSQSSYEENYLSTLKNFILHNSKVKISLQTVEDIFQQRLESTNQNIIALCDTLKEWELEVDAMQIEHQHLEFAPLPSILIFTDSESSIFLNYDKKNQLVDLLDPVFGFYQISLEDLKLSWDGTIVTAESSSDIEEEDYSEKEKRYKLQRKMNMNLEAVYIIALEGEKNKNIDLIKHHLSYFQLDNQVKVIVWDAVDGNKISDDDLDLLGVKVYDKWKITESQSKWYNREITAGELGCSLSHWMVWEDAFNKKYSKVLILEEDFIPVIDADFSLLNKCDFEWDLMYLGRTPKEKDKELSNFWVKPGFSYCTHAYILNNTGIEKLLKTRFCEKLIPVDEFLPALYSNHPRNDIRDLFKEEINAIATYKNLVNQYSGHDSTTNIKQNVKHESLYLNFGAFQKSWEKKYINPVIIDGNEELVISKEEKYILRFPLFNKLFCDHVISEAENINKWMIDRHKNYPTNDMLLEVLGLNDIYNRIINKYVLPIILKQWKFKFVLNNSLSENFIVRYKPDQQAYLAIHHDFSLVTMNLCLNNEFDGAGTVFPDYEKKIVLKEPGEVLIHPGRISHRHGALPVKDGKRYIIVSFLRDN